MADLNVVTSDSIKIDSELKRLNETSIVKDVVVGLLIGISVFASDTVKVRQDPGIYPLCRNVATSDNVRNSDSPTAFLPALNIVVSDSNKTTDSPTISTTATYHEVIVNEPVKVRESLDWLNDRIIVSELATVNLSGIASGKNINVYESVKVGDAVVRGPHYERVQVKEYVALKINLTISKVETVKIIESRTVSSLNIINLTVYDSVKVGELSTASEENVLAVNVNESAIIFDTNEINVRFTTINVFDTVKCGEFDHIIFEPVSTQDSVIVKDFSTVSIGYIVSPPQLYEISKVSDVPNVTVNFSARAGDSVIITDFPTIQIWGACNIATSDDIKSRDYAEKKFKYYTISVYDNIFVREYANALITMGWIPITPPSGLWIDIPSGADIWTDV